MSGYELASYEPEQREDYLRLLHDAWAALGDTAKAEEYYRAMAVAER